MAAHVKQSPRLKRRAGAAAGRRVRAGRSGAGAGDRVRRRARQAVRAAAAGESRQGTADARRRCRSPARGGVVPSANRSSDTPSQPSVAAFPAHDRAGRQRSAAARPSYDDMTGAPEPLELPDRNVWEHRRRPAGADADSRRSSRRPSAAPPPEGVAGQRVLGAAGRRAVDAAGAPAPRRPRPSAKRPSKTPSGACWRA